MQYDIQTGQADNNNNNSNNTYNFQSMSSCHRTCLTCTSALFNSCLTCSTTLALSETTCNCLTPWQAECTGELNMRQLMQFIDMFIKLYLVGVMLLYVLKVRIPLSYRCWSAINGLSLLVYNQVFYLEYEDQLCLQAMSVSNGPYYPAYRIMQLSTSHIFPTMVLVIVMVALLVLLYYPFTVFIGPRDSIIEYLKHEGLHMFDCTYYFASKMMFFYIGKFIKEFNANGGLSALYIAVMAVYGVFVLLAWIRTIYRYHEGTMEQFAFDTPIFLYTLLAPASMIGLALATSQVILVVVYCAPLALLLLILLLNRNMKILTKPNIKFFLVEIVMIGLTIAFIFLNDQFKTYLLIAIVFINMIVVTVQVGMLYHNGFDLDIGKVHPVLDDEPPVAKKLYNEDIKQGYH